MDLLDVGSGRFTWRRLRGYLNGLRNVRESALWRELDADGEGLWDVDTYLLANVVDLLNFANWQRSEDGSKGRNKPKPIKRPSDHRAELQKAEDIRAAIAERRKRRGRR